ncbi:hypothetical protein [Streptomyces sp. NPDC012888]|uniref:hypothetical protein n=1 Tax=Streptomyces sp. NPDC012888 TaxID=3364855 RepID=UPI0036BF149C
MYAFTHARLHAARTAELAAEAAAWRLAEQGRPTTVAAPAPAAAGGLRVRLGLVLIHAGTRLAHPA